MKTVRILHCDFHPLTLQQTVDSIIEMIAKNERGYLCTVNVAILMMMRDNPRLADFVHRARFVVADGQPLIWASRGRTVSLPERVTGVDLVDHLCARAARLNMGIYLLGAQRDVLQKAAVRLRQTHSGLNICGIADGYFSPLEAPARARSVRESGARILIVAMGVPRQEEFVEQYWDELGVNFAMGVGGSFDVIAGLRHRAPHVLQTLGLEWAFRLIQEPRRLFPRYLTTNSRFVYLWMSDLLGRSEAFSPEHPWKRCGKG